MRRTLTKRMVTGLALLLSWPALAGPPLQPRLLDDETYSETVTLVLSLPGELHAQLELAISNLGLGDGNGLCRLMLTDGRSTFKAQPVFGRDGWRFEAPGRLVLGPCELRAGEQQVVVQARLEGATLEATLAAPLQPVRPPHHRLELGERFFEQEILLRWARAEVRLQAPGFATRQVAGYGALHRFRVTAWPDELGRQLVRVLALDEQGAFWALLREVPGGARWQGSVWPPGSGEPLALQALQRGADERMTLVAGGQSYVLTPGASLLRQAPVEEAGFFGHLVRPFLGNPVTRTRRAVLEGEGPALPARAILETTSTE